MTEIIRILARLWTLENESAVDAHGHRAVKYVIRQLWPELAFVLDRCSLVAIKLEEIPAERFDFGRYAK